MSKEIIVKDVVGNTCITIEDGQKIGISKKCITDFRDINLIFGTISKLLTSYRRGDIKQITFEGIK